MEKSAFDELKTTGKLPSPSGVALQIIDLTRKDDVSVAELAHLVQADPALSGRLIKFANSAMAGPRRPIVAVADAIRLLGIGTVRQLALGFSILGHHRAGTCKSFDYHAFWSCSLASAIAANALCLRTRTAAADEAFTCGLLARIGSLALATLHPDGFAELLDRQGEPGGNAIVPLEREMFRTDHNELCAALLEDWMLPRIFVSTVFHQEDPAQGNWPDGSRELTLCNILHLSVRLGDYCVANDGKRATMVADLVFDAARVGVDSDALALLTDQVVVEWREWGRILEVKTADLPPFSSLAKAAAQAKATGVALAPPIPEAKADDGAAAIENKLGLRARLEPLRILVVDDDPAILALLKHLLAQDGHTVVGAKDGREALRQAMVDRPQMIVCDWMMPEMDGLSLCRALRESEEGRQIYFLLLTGLEREDNLIEAFEAGVDDFVTKPFAPKVLMARLRAGHRVIRLQEEALRDSQSLRRFATELAVANRRLRQAALTDPLTGLPESTLRDGTTRAGMDCIESQSACAGADDGGRGPLQGRERHLRPRCGRSTAAAYRFVAAQGRPRGRRDLSPRRRGIPRDLPGYLHTGRHAVGRALAAGRGRFPRGPRRHSLPGQDLDRRRGARCGDGQVRRTAESRRSGSLSREAPGRRSGAIG